MDSKQLRELIHIMDDVLGNTSYLAHIAMHDFNLSDAHLDALLNEDIDQNQADPIFDMEYRFSDVEILKRFLRWLKTIPEEIREDVAEFDDDILRRLDE